MKFMSNFSKGMAISVSVFVFLALGLVFVGEVKAQGDTVKVKCELKLQKDADPNKVEKGRETTYRYRVTNSGDVSVTDIKLTDNKIGNVSCPKDKLKAGEYMLCTKKATINQNVTNIGTVRGKSAVDGKTVIASDDAVVVLKSKDDDDDDDDDDDKKKKPKVAPKTGTGTNIAVVLLISAAITAGIILVQYRKGKFIRK